MITQEDMEQRLAAQASQLALYRERLDPGFFGSSPGYTLPGVIKNINKKVDELEENMGPLKVAVSTYGKSNEEALDFRDRVVDALAPHWSGFSSQGLVARLVELKELVKRVDKLEGLDVGVTASKDIDEYHARVVALLERKIEILQDENKTLSRKLTSTNDLVQDVSARMSTFSTKIGYHVRLWMHDTLLKIEDCSRRLGIESKLSSVTKNVIKETSLGVGAVRETLDR